MTFKTHILNINNITTDNDSYRAYLMLLDTEDIPQRRILIDKILKDPFISYLSLQNGALNKNEKKKIFDKISSDPKSSFMLLKNGKLTSKQRELIVACILEDKEYSLNAVEQSTLSEEENEIIYEQFKMEYFSTDDIETYYHMYCLFRKYISDDYKNKFIDMIIKTKRYEFANRVLNIDNNLNENLRDRLESISLMENLTSFLLFVF